MQTEHERLTAQLWRWRNPDKVRAQKRRYYEKHRAAILAEFQARGKTPKARAARRARYQRDKQTKLPAQRRRNKYGIDHSQFLAMVAAQGNCCAICQRPPEKSVRGLHVDHDHVTMQIRALLCHQCNTGLGAFGDDPRLIRLAFEYLEKWRAMGGPDPITDWRGFVLP